MGFDYLLTNFVRAIILLALTYNPTGWCYFGWIDARPDLPPSLVLFVGIILFLGYVFFFKQAMKQVGGLGIIVLAVLFVLLISALAELGGLFWMHRPLLPEWILLAVIAAFMATSVTVRGK